MVECAPELLLDLQVTPVAELWLAGLQQVLALLRVVRVMAIRAGDAVDHVLRAREVTVLLPVLVAVQAPRADVRGRSILEPENLGLVAPALHVCFARPVASLAAVPLRTSLGVQRGYKVRRSFVVLEEVLCRHVLVAGLAGFRAHVKRRIRRTRILFPLLLAGLGLITVLVRSGPKRRGNQTQGQQEWKPVYPYAWETHGSLLHSVRLCLVLTSFMQSSRILRFSSVTRVTLACDVARMNSTCMNTTTMPVV